MSSVEEEEYRVFILRCPESRIIVEEAWKDQNAQLHRIDLPAVTHRSRQTGAVTREEFWFRGSIHRHNQPAILGYNETGNCIFRAWREGGRHFRDGDLPTIEHLDADTGSVLRAEYKEDGKLHRLTGPAVVIYDLASGQVTETEWHQQGRKFTPPALSKGWQP